jgi:hypothetical protein
MLIPLEHITLFSCYQVMEHIGKIILEDNFQIQIVLSARRYHYQQITVYAVVVVVVVMFS